MRFAPLSALTPNDVESWWRLSEASLEPNPFLTPAVLMTAENTVGETSDIRLTIVEADGEWLAVLPLSRMGRFRSTPLHYASTGGRFLGRRAPLCAPLVDRAQAEAAVTALVDHLRSRHTWTPGLIELTLLPEGELAEVIRRVCSARGIPVQERSRFTRAYATTSSDTLAPDHLSAERRKRLRRQQRGLERLLGAPLEFIDHGADITAFERLLDLEFSGWKRGRGATLSRSEVLAWRRATFDAFSDRNGCRVLELRAGGTTLFMSLIYCASRKAFGILDAYDEQFERFSPGAIGRVLEQRMLLSTGEIAAFDPCIHPARYGEATKLYPERRDMLELLIAPRAPARLLLRLRPVLRRVLAIAHGGKGRIPT